MHSLRRWNALLFAALAALAMPGLAGCERAAAPGAADAGTAPVTLVLGDQVRMTRALVEASGAFDGIPYQVEWANFQGAAPLFEALKAGAVDTAPAGDSPTLAAAAAGTPFRIVAVATSSPRGVGIVVPAGSALRSIADLDGQELVVSSARGSIAHYLALGALKEAGVPAERTTLSYLQPVDALTAFKSGHIQAWATFDPYLASAELSGARVLRDGEGINSGDGYLAVSERALADPAKRAALADVVRRLARAQEWRNANIAAYTGLYARITGLAPDIAERVIGRGHTGLQPVTPAAIDRLRRVADVYAAERLLARDIDVARLFDTRLFPATVEP
ncbi:ABC transporter substrate-binding protein [Thauera linaloolentis]|uniref:Putative aliphatic sulfonates-binding protein n=1 Tax=Thauera linaloolentis (strain DSM 12138 / JCM 21573 / CCUG 41526 / CIP 105981 / IAM 15112 / NBRC 102519 / 47Lol) TaxID=1123367 RepID=N6ZB87_THAL4|nr:ABC transporter substrate-binding protein [Thauera linaloolentis]ENO89434.1 ABC nitrate/sulfonate/bicarbonate family transporter, periplasmic ligand binding protein [Thauera linaloolentis 47Lol = DSM 12138]MCM8566929.1 ABC transporter substrate-binding protein [Thauera linaloolentis]